MAIREPSPASTQMLTNLVSVQRSYTPVIVNHYNVWPVFDVYANVADWDLGGVGKEVRRIMREEESEAAARHHAQSPRPGGDHAEFVLPPRPRPDLRGRAGLPAHDGQLPVLARSVHHPDGPARRHGRYSLDVVRHRHHAERAVADGLHHVHRCRHGEQHPDGDVCQR